MPTEPPRERTLAYQPHLDGLRALAVSAVVCFHLHLLHGGYVGVDVFFVLSGYLITRLLLAEREQTGGTSFANFYRRRARRLLPALVLLLVGALALVAVSPHHPGAHQTLLGVPASLFYLSAWLEAFGHFLGGLNHTWSLSVEEYFYFVWPMVVALVLLRSRRHLVRNVVAVAALATAYQLAAAYVFGWSFNRIYYAPDTRADQLLFGCVLAVAATRLPALLAGRGRRAATGVAAALGAAFLVGWIVGAPAQFRQPAYVGWGIVVVGLAALAVVTWLHLAPASLGARALALAPLVWLGQRSYGIYLWHFLLIWFFLTRVGYGLKLDAIAVVGTLALATASYALVETPIRRSGLRGLIGVRADRPAVKPGQPFVD